MGILSMYAWTLNTEVALLFIGLIIIKLYIMCNTHRNHYTDIKKIAKCEINIVKQLQVSLHTCTETIIMIVYNIIIIILVN